MPDPLAAAEAIAATLTDAYGFDAPGVTFGAAMRGDEALGAVQVRVPLAMMNRHGLVAGATGTGKTKTLQVLAEQLSAADRQFYTAATDYIPTDGIVRKTAQGIVTRASGEVAKARAIYEWVVENTRVKVGYGIAGKVAERGEPLLIANIEENDIYSAPNNPQYETVSLLSVPLRVNDVSVGPDHRGGGLHEDDWLVGYLAVELGSVILVVPADTDHFGGDHRGQQRDAPPGDDVLGRLPGEQRGAVIDDDPFGIGDAIGDVVAGLHADDLHRS